MTQTIDLQKMGCIPITESEIQHTNGGGLPKWMKAIGVGWLVDQVVSNWDEIKEGAKDGWKSVQYK